MTCASPASHKLAPETDGNLRAKPGGWLYLISLIAEWFNLGNILVCKPSEANLNHRKSC
jgi:hypothetical protein